jgi:hypothetical protein
LLVSAAIVTTVACATSTPPVPANNTAAPAATQRASNPNGPGNYPAPTAPPTRVPANPPTPYPSPRP